MVDYSKPIQSGHESDLSGEPGRKPSVDESASRTWSLFLGFCMLLLSLFLLLIVIPMSAKAEFADHQAGLIPVAAHAVEPPADSDDASYSSAWMPGYWFSDSWPWLIAVVLLLVLPVAIRWFGANRRSRSKRFTDSGGG